MDTSTIANTSNKSDQSFAGSYEKVTGLKASDAVTDTATVPKIVHHETADDGPDYLRPWELVPVFTAMALAIFILGLASNINPFSLKEKENHLLMLNL